MKNVTDSFVSLGHWPSAGSFGFNTDIFSTNLINLSVVLGVLIFFGKGVLSDLLDNRKRRILNTIRTSEELRERAIEQLEKARARLRKVEMEADQFRVNGYAEIEREKVGLITKTSQTLEKVQHYQLETLQFEQEKTINQIRELVGKEAFEGAVGTLNSSLNNDNELHSRTIDDNIGMLEEKRD
uniref:ATP synthase subunit b, chloroplastic n=1 Tax=Ceropegia sunhangiana TaxID=3060224 RepID=A0AA49X879_9GENT|nr:ATP synthase CF0 subunit I [Ceropegia dolichophylla]YP_010847981.1 ATP synthase CF0 subunit I [Ceropegia longifolia]WEV92118.1 ATP synthase CF0 subunit I [Ceropegia dolichophylla]WEV92631.1 ATP synthase CF0 subunit I [Ceropegia longifolia]WLN31712.1 CF0 subunit I [Ceropegia sunhangiana]